MNKVDMFFQLLRGVYGASKVEATWPTELDLQLAKKMWSDNIEKHTEEELVTALKNARAQMEKCEEGFDWPNIGLILSGAKRCGNQSHKVFLPSPEKSTEQKHNERLMANEHIKSLKELFT